MANLEDTIRSAAPGGSIAKPLMLALLALLASGALFRGSGAAAAASSGPQPSSNEGAGGPLGGSGGLLDKLQKAAWAMWRIFGLVPAKINRCRIISSVQRLALISLLAQGQAFRKRS